MFWLYLFICFLLYGAFAYVSYSATLKASPFFYLIGLSFAVTGNALWLFISRHTADKVKLLFYGMIWDAVILASFIMVPFLFFNTQLNLKEWIAFAFVLIGILILKV